MSSRPFHYRRLMVQSWKITKLPADQRRQAGRALLRDIKTYLGKLTDGSNLPRSDF